MDRCLQWSQLIPDIRGDDGAETIPVDRATAVLVTNMKHGALRPLAGFMDSQTVCSVIRDWRLPDGQAWGMPVVFQTSMEHWSKVREGDEINLSMDGRPVALARVVERFTLDLKAYCSGVFRTDSPDHPGVRRVVRSGPYALALSLISASDPGLPFRDITMFPEDTLRYFRSMGWKTVAGFQTRNVPHRGHEELQRMALRMCDGLFINPVVGTKKPGDYRDEVIIESYRRLIRSYYPGDRVVMSPLHYEMMYAGPREATLHAIIRRNFGCTHFIVGRDHAGVGNYYGPYEAIEAMEALDLGIEIIRASEVFYCRACGSLVTEMDCGHGEDKRQRFSGTMIRNSIERGSVPDENIMRREVYEAVASYGNPFRGGDV
ncbi:sulfate adenylyltransferase [Thermogymnomonas acidicola]|uniref:Sulfate adenylyltransferase n=1 Tax=Thermogymnomonas acidicola TaxID=399579 RepID=A0AA37F9B4_9ARCH|nr:sulfate adenylyltransferase [Thermogymnomonas acidicola]GGM72588.1 sulfate adenylyltransferase [Thermogymnomonas acidicola]